MLTKHACIALIEKGIDPSTIESTTSPFAFFHMLEYLKSTKRQGWVDYGISDGESIGDHMYRMSIITRLCPPSLKEQLNLDIERCTMMALTHDMAEAVVGDLTPQQKEKIEHKDAYGKGEKSRREQATMHYIGEKLLGNVAGGAMGKDFIGWWQEYEDSKTNNSLFVHDIDKMDLLLQMVEYERKRDGSLDLEEFTEVAGRIHLQEMKDWGEELLRERHQMWNDFERHGKGTTKFNPIKIWEILHRQAETKV